MNASIEKPRFGTVEFKLLTELQKELCRAYVHMERRASYRSYSMSSPNVDEIDQNGGEQERYEALSAASNDRYLAGALSVIEDEALLSALGRIRRFLQVAKRKKLMPAGIGVQLEALSAPLKEVRDMREHYDEYLQGGGQFPNNFVRSHTFEDGSVFSSDAKWSVQVGAEETLGCRLKVMDVAKAIGELRKEIEDARLWILPWKAIDLAKRGSPPNGLKT